MSSRIHPVWELESLFRGGSQSSALEKELKALEDELEKLESFQRPLKEEILHFQNIQSRLQDVDSFIACLLAQDVEDVQAVEKKTRLTALNAHSAIVSTKLDEALAGLNEVAFAQLLKDPEMQKIAFALKERRVLAKEKLPLIQESLIETLAIDGYHGWQEIYSELVGKMRIPFEEEGNRVQWSIGQAENKLSTPNREMRQGVFALLNRAWETQEELIAQILNHLGGFRLKIYEKRGWKPLLKEPLECNRMRQETLEMMWATIEKYKPQVQLFFKKQAELLGIDKLSWADVGAPLQNLENPTIPFQKAQELIIHQFGKFSSKMADFAKHAFDQGWIEAEDREGKRPGAFCAQFPERRQSRIFMTYDGSIDNVMTLAHELGHAYHNAVVQELPMMAQNYRMNVAETASTFAEWLVSDCFLEEEMTHAQKHVWLYEKINRSCLFLLNIQARFLFEKQFYEERKKGFVLSNRLNQIMQEAQETAFSSALAAYHPRFWAAKMHFYFTEVPFYNFPYTFGYLFSLGIYARALKGGFENSYDALLKDTGQMNVEELAQKHLNVDLSQAPFWEMALDLIAKDITQFISESA